MTRVWPGGSSGQVTTRNPPLPTRSGAPRLPVACRVVVPRRIAQGRPSAPAPVATAPACARGAHARLVRSSPSRRAAPVREIRMRRGAPSLSAPESPSSRLRSPRHGPPSTAPPRPPLRSPRPAPALVAVEFPQPIAPGWGQPGSGASAQVEGAETEAEAESGTPLRGSRVGHRPGCRKLAGTALTRCRGHNIGRRALDLSGPGWKSLGPTQRFSRLRDPGRPTRHLGNCGAGQSEASCAFPSWSLVVYRGAGS